MPRGLRRCRKEYWASRPKPSAYISSIDTLNPGDKVILWARVSRRQQDHSGNLDAAEANLREEAKRRGVEVVGVYRYVGSGKSAFKQWYEAAWLARDHGARLLAETTNRFIRHPLFHTRDEPTLQARWDHLAEMAGCVGQVTLVTVLDPDASWQAERAYQTKRGMDFKNRRGGRPRKCKPGEKKTRREQMTSKINQLQNAGLSVRKIADELGLHPTQVQRWKKVQS